MKSALTPQRALSPSTDDDDDDDDDDTSFLRFSR